MNCGSTRSAEKLPHFIIVGAAKSGTTTLHRALARHPDVYIPYSEINFFDIDDILAHPEFFVHNRGVSLHDYEGDFEDYLDWYRAQFAPARDGQLIGEDTTTYLASRHAAKRIEALLPEVKLIAILRDPVERAYSQYWHDVRAGRRTLDFEGTLRTSPESVLWRGFYHEHLLRYRHFLDHGQMLVLLFEDLAADPVGCMRQVCQFLGLSELPPDATAAESHHNAGRPPFNLRVRLLVNALGHKLFAPPRPLPNMPDYGGPKAVEEHMLRPHERLALALEQRLPRRKAPPMCPKTRAMLQAVYARHNAGLSSLLGRDLAERWHYMRNAA